MKIGKAIRPYSAIVTEKGDRTMFYCTDSSLKNGKWEYSPSYVVAVKNLNFPIPEKNPEGYKIVPKAVEGVSLSRYKEKTNVAIWCTDIEIQDKDGTTIIESVKVAAKYVGKKLSDIQEQKATEQLPQDLDDLPF